MKNNSVDIRTLCSQHADEVRVCGYWLLQTSNTNRSACDKCNRQGKEYRLKDGRRYDARHWKNRF